MDNLSKKNSSEEKHISSLVVQVLAASVPEVARRIGSMEWTEVPIASPKGKLVVCLETTTMQQVTNNIDVINAMPGVLGCTLVSHHVEDTAGLDEPMDGDAQDRTEPTP